MFFIAEISNEAIPVSSTTCTSTGDLLIVRIGSSRPPCFSCGAHPASISCWLTPLHCFADNQAKHRFTACELCTHRCTSLRWRGRHSNRACSSGSASRLSGSHSARTRCRLHTCCDHYTDTLQGHKHKNTESEIHSVYLVWPHKN